MKKLASILLSIISLLYAETGICQKKIKTLIVDGQNNHAEWPKVTYLMKSYLEQTEKFTVDIARSQYTWQGEKFLNEFAIEGLPQTESLEKSKADPNFSPDFDKYDLVISNFGWNAAPWPEATKKKFEEFMSAGGGLVVIHAADNSFPDWKAYNEMIALGGWGDRTEKDGPYVYYDDDNNLQRDMSPGKAGSHGAQHEFVIKTRKRKHPITKGMPEEWLHTKDELYDHLRGPAENMTILATAYADKETKGSGRHEPVLMTINYGKGRIFHSTLGHATEAVQGVGFITTLIRGSEWAATGKVKTKIPKDFPTKEKATSREFEK